jgi:hypothetical protein
VSVTLLCAVFACGASVPSALGITLGQIDDFEDGTTMGWSEGLPSPNPPGVATGGPGGAGDRYLRNVSSGVGTAGSRLVMFNTVQWSGDYVAAGVDVVRMQVANFGAEDLHLRLAIEGAGTRYGSTAAVVVPADGAWRLASFGLSDSDLSLVGGTAPLPTALAAVGTLRILSQVNGPSWVGERIAATLGVDDIEAAQVVPVEAATWGRIKELYRPMP